MTDRSILSSDHPSVASTGTTIDLTDRSAGRRDLALAGGLIALVLATLLLQALIGEVIPPVLVFDVAFVALAVGIVRSQARWMRWAAAGLSLLLIIANAPFAAADLAHPETMAGFLPTLAIIVLAVGNIVLGVASARGRSVSGRRVWSPVAAVLVLGLGLSAVQSSGLVDDAAVAGDVAVEARNVTYPETIEVPATSEGIFLTNADPIRHTFVVEGQEVAVELPGSTARRVPIGLPPRDYRFHCDIAGHEDMEGTLVVR